MSHQIVKSNPILANEGATRTDLKLGADMAEAPSTNSSVTIGHLYRKALSRAKKLTEMSKDTAQTELLRSHFRDRAFNLECNAGYLAHCLAWFGDLKLSDLDLVSARLEVLGMNCEQCNPWMLGLSIIQTEIEDTTTQ